MPDLSAIYRHIEDHRDAHLAKVREFLRQPSVSAENEGIEDCAKLLREYYRRLGCQEAELVPTDGHPGVWAFYDAGAPKTLVNYCMYDVQPVEGEAWTSPPFEAHLRPMDEFPLVVINRGAINSKGPYRAWLNALESIIAVEGRLPINLMFTAEGEEELGSPHFPQIIEKVAHRLQAADGVFIADAAQARNGTIEMTLGYKGNVYFELTCSGEAWGRGPRKYDIHSGFKAIVDSPAWRLTQALATMVSLDGNFVKVDGWYDQVAQPSEEDLELVGQLSGKFDPEVWKRILNVDVFIDNLEGRELILKFLYSTTLNIDGIWGGYTGPGAKTVLPHQVTVKMDARLVPNQDANDILPLIRRHLDEHGFPDIQARMVGGYGWSKTSVNSGIVQAVLASYRKHGVDDVVIWPHSGGSAPMYLYTRPPLNLPLATGGLGHGSRAHSPDEYLVIEGNDKVAGLVEMEKSFVDIVYEYGRSRR